MKQFALFILIFLFQATVALAQYASIWDQIPEDKKTKAFKRYEAIYKQIAFPYDTIPMVQYATEIEREIQKIKSHQRETLTELQWTFIGPTGVKDNIFSPHWGVTSGRIRSIAVHPTNPSIIYIGVANGGIWKTTNGGETWADIGDYNVGATTFGSIAIDPSNPDIIYAGAGELLSIGQARKYGKGLFKSTNAGSSWIKATDSFGNITCFGDLVVSPYNSNVLYAALGSGYLLFVTQNLPNEGIWKSTDAGETWIRTLDMQDANDIVIHPTDPNIVYAATGGWFTTSGFYISTDSGNTWTQSNNGLQNANTIGRMQIDIAKSSPDILYSVIYDGIGNTPKAYKTTNGGIIWTQISQGVMLGGFDGSSWWDQGYYDLCIAVNPTDPNHVLLGNVELHETKNGSDFSVKRIPGGTYFMHSVVHLDYHELVYAPSDPNLLFIGCDGGVYSSPDAGLTFENLNNDIRTIEFWRIASHPTNENIVLCGAQDNFNSISFNGLVNVWVSVTGADGMEGFFDYMYPDSIVYASRQEGRLYKSTNGGHNFSLIKNTNGFFITTFFMHPTDHRTLYSPSNLLWYSSDGGVSWSVKNVDPPVLVQDLVVTMAQSKVNPNNMILAGGGDLPAPLPDNPEVKISTDGGVHWSDDLSPNIPGEPRWITKVVTHPTDSNTMYIVRSGLSENNKIYRTTDLGNTWTNLSGDLPNLPCWDLFVHPYLIEADTANHLFIGTDIGVYTSTNNGLSWQYASADVPFMPVMDFDYVEYGNLCKLRVGTNGRSAYETEWSLLQLPSAPILVSPEDNSSFPDSTTSILFVWEKSQPEAEMYWFELDTSNLFNTSFIDSTITDTSYLYSYLQIDKRYWWRVKANNSAGWGNFSEVRTFDTYVTSVENEETVIEFALEQNYPNPFNAMTSIKYSIPEESDVKLEILNLLGERVELLVKETKSAGIYDVVWDAGNMSSGIYFYRIQAGDFVETKKMILMK
jgi:photosystem II stability/assembly factor-like uncharacterized protein